MLQALGADHDAGARAVSRVEVIGGATLYLGDCREIMPSVQADALVTDPVWPNCPANSIAGWENPWGLWSDTCSSMPDVARIVVCMRSDSDPRFLKSIPAHFEFFRSIQMPYVIPGYIGRKLGGDEVAYWFGEPVKPGPGRNLIPGRAPAAQPGGRPSNGHPMSRAQAHFDWLLSWCSDSGEIVIDPFMGSGTTGAACAKLGREFIGIEIHEPYFDLACRRIEAATRQSDLFVTPATHSPAKQEAML